MHYIFFTDSSSLEWMRRLLTDYFSPSDKGFLTGNSFNLITRAFFIYLIYHLETVGGGALLFIHYFVYNYCCLLY